MQECIVKRKRKGSQQTFVRVREHLLIIGKSFKKADCEVQPRVMT